MYKFSVLLSITAYKHSVYRDSDSYYVWVFTECSLRSARSRTVPLLMSFPFHNTPNYRVTIQLRTECFTKIFCMLEHAATPFTKPPPYLYILLYIDLQQICWYPLQTLRCFDPVFGSYFTSIRRVDRKVTHNTFFYKNGNM